MTHDFQTAEMTPTFRTRLNAILKEWVTPLLEPHGFRKRNNVYERRVGDTAWIVDVQWSRWKSTDRAEFTLNCGVFVAGVTSVYFNRPDPSRIQVTDCCIHTRIGMLAEDKLDKWWRFQADDVAAQVDRSIGEEASSRLRAHVIPFLNRFQTPQDALEFLVTPRPKEDKHVWPQSPAIAFCYAATIASLLGRREDLATYLERATEAGRGSPIEDVVLRVRDHLQARQSG